MDTCMHLYGLPLGQSYGGILSVFNKYTITYSDYSTLNFPSNYNLVYIQRIFKRYFFCFVLFRVHTFKISKSAIIEMKPQFSRLSRELKRLHEGLLSLMLNDLS